MFVFNSYLLNYSSKSHMTYKLLVSNFFLFHRFKFRATNVMGQFTDSDYSDPVKTLGKTCFAVYFHLYSTC